MKYPFSMRYPFSYQTGCWLVITLILWCSDRAYDDDLVKVLAVFAFAVYIANVLHDLLHPNEKPQN